LICDIDTFVDIIRPVRVVSRWKPGSWHTSILSIWLKIRKAIMT